MTLQNTNRKCQRVLDAKKQHSGVDSQIISKTQPHAAPTIPRSSTQQSTNQGYLHIGHESRNDHLYFTFLLPLPSIATTTITNTQKQGKTTSHTKNSLPSTDPAPPKNQHYHRETQRHSERERQPRPTIAESYLGWESSSGGLPISLNPLQPAS